MILKTAIQRTFKMGMFKYLSKFEDLFEQYIGCHNPHINPKYDISVFSQKQQAILKSMGCDEKTPIFSVGGFFGDTQYDIISISPPKGSDNYTDYFYNKEGIWCYHFNRADYKSEKEFEKAINNCYQELQNLFTFLNLFEKQMDELNKLQNIQKDNFNDITDK